MQNRLVRKGMKKILGILVCLMLITTFFAVAKNIEVVNTEQMLDKDPNTGSFDDCVDVPVWEVGHWWKYRIRGANINLEKENLSIAICGEIDDLTLEVVEDTGDFYKLEIHQVELRGNYSFFVDLGHGPINITGGFLHLLKPTTLEGSILINKSDLGIKQFNPKISGRITVKINEQPYFNLPSVIHPIPIRATIDLNTDFDVPYTIIDFPLCVNQTWGVPTSNVSVNGTIESPLLRVMYILYKISKGVIVFPPPPPEVIPFLELLPDVNIGKLLNLIFGTNVCHTPGLPDIFVCTDTEMVTVPAGSFLV